MIRLFRTLFVFVFVVVGISCAVEWRGVVIRIAGTFNVTSWLNIEYVFICERIVIIRKEVFYFCGYSRPVAYATSTINTFQISILFKTKQNPKQKFKIIGIR